MSELPGLAHMESHIPPRLHPLLWELVTPKSITQIQTDLKVRSSNGFYDRAQVIIAVMGMDLGTRLTVARVALVRMAAGIDPCWCEE